MVVYANAWLFVLHADTIVGKLTRSRVGWLSMGIRRMT
jgi:hypothetical protein